MTKNKIIIDGVEYIKLSKFKELEKKKVTIKEVEKELDLKEYIITDPANVCCIHPIKKEMGEVDEIDTSLGLYKKVDKPKITLDYNHLKSGAALTINGTRISKELVDQIKKIASVWFSDTPEIFMYYNKDKKEFLKDNPVMFVFGCSMCFVIAPRIEMEDD
ncbi:hypothetical protein LCGC14_0477870 [marine sediment metagenome]|uniref:Uncharacterized protein n=1 Tax=marine sediment metagenome TaxID=412755 RepID=A0A0F9UXE3_9ZZZZ